MKVTDLELSWTKQNRHLWREALCEEEMYAQSEREDL